MVGVTFNVPPVELLLQITVPAQPVAVSTALVPKQIELLLLVTVGLNGLAFTVTYIIELESLLQPF